MKYFEKTSEIDLKKELKIYEIGAQHHVGTFNISAAAKRKNVKAELGGKPGDRYIDIYNIKKKWFSKPEKILVKRYDVWRGSSKDPKSPAVLLKEVNLKTLERTK